MRHRKIITVNVRKPTCAGRLIWMLYLWYGVIPATFEPAINFMKLGGNLALFVTNRHSKFSMPHHQKCQKC